MAVNREKLERRSQQMDGNLMLSDNVKFGKYKGKSIQSVIENDVGYVSWCIENISNFVLDNEAYSLYQYYLGRLEESKSQNQSARMLPEDYLPGYEEGVW